MDDRAHPGDLLTAEIFDLSLIVMRVDSLSLVFAYVFEIATLISIIFAWHIRDAVQQVAGLVYSGAAIAGVFAGDLVTLFVMWELTALASVFLFGHVGRDFRSGGTRYLDHLDRVGRSSFGRGDYSLSSNRKHRL